MSRSDLLKSSLLLSFVLGLCQRARLAHGLQPDEVLGISTVRIRLDWRRQNSLLLALEVSRGNCTGIEEHFQLDQLIYDQFERQRSGVTPRSDRWACCSRNNGIRNCRPGLIGTESVALQGRSTVRQKVRHRIKVPVNERHKSDYRNGDENQEAPRVIV